MTTDEFIGELQSRGYKPKKRGRYWVARCPCHPDQHASMQVFDDDGEPGCHCHAAGCEASYTGARAVFKVLGIPTPPRKYRHNYVATKGRVLWTKVREQQPGQKKKIFIEAPDGTASKPDDAPDVLYREPSLRAAPLGTPIYIMEGEKCADIGAEHGLTCVSPPNGSATPFNPEWGPLFTGKPVFIWRDKDEPGDVFAAAWAEALTGWAHGVTIVESGTEGKGDDIEQHVAAGLSASDPVVIEHIPWSPRTGLVIASSVSPRPVEWVMPNLIPAGEFTLVDGQPEAGKTMFAMAAIACLTAQLPWQDGSTGKKRAAIVYTTEDRKDTTIVPRLQGMGADMDLVWVQDEWDGPLDDKGFADLEADVLAIAPGIVVLDALLDFILPVTDDSPSLTKPVLRRLRRLAIAANCAIVGLRHHTKGAGLAMDKGDKVSLLHGYGGSHYAQAARSAIAVMRVDGYASSLIKHVKSTHGQRHMDFYLERENFRKGMWTCLPNSMPSVDGNLTASIQNALLHKGSVLTDQELAGAIGISVSQLWVQIGGKNIDKVRWDIIDQTPVFRRTDILA